MCVFSFQMLNSDDQISQITLLPLTLSLSWLGHLRGFVATKKYGRSNMISVYGFI